MKAMLRVITVLIFILLGCSEKVEKKSGPSTPENTTEKKKTPSVQQIPDSIKTIANLRWHSHVETAFKQAKKEHKNVVIMVGEDNCRWCVKMKERTLTDARIQDALEKYILVSIKRSDKEAVKYVPQFDGNIPSFFFMTADKEIIEPVVGYYKADDFLGYINEIEESL